MQRRDLLGAVGALGTGVALAGCLADGPDGEAVGPESNDRAAGGGSPDARAFDGTPTERNRAEPDRSTAESDRTTAEPEWTADTHEIGDRDAVAFPAWTRPHDVVVENASDETRGVSIEVVADVDGDREVAFDSLADLEPGEVRRLVLLEPGTYEIDLETDVGRVVESIDRSWFDCNASTTTASIGANGVETTSLSTLIACSSPQVESSAIERVDARCAGAVATEDDTGFDGRTSVSSASNAVVIEGTIAAPTPCHDVSLTDVSYDSAADVLHVTVSTDERSGACIQCVGALEYVATVEFSRGFPGRVDVRHAGWNGQELATTDSL